MKQFLIVLALTAFAHGYGHHRQRLHSSYASSTFAPVTPPEVEEYVHQNYEEEKKPLEVIQPPLHRVQTYSKPADSSYTSYSATSVRDTVRDTDYDERLIDEQNSNAKYAFASAVDDGIQDQSQVRSESRDGKKVTGSYSYSDGFFRRTTKYEADENGYRVVEELVEPLGDEGPMVDLVNGKADVHTQVGGIDTQYSVHAQDIKQFSKLGKPKMTEEFN